MVMQPQGLIETPAGVQAFFETPDFEQEPFAVRFASRNRVQSWMSGVEILKDKKDEIVALVCQETGKSTGLAEAEFQAAVSFALLIANACLGEVGAQLRSAQTRKSVTLGRVPLGNAVLISSYNTPLPNLLWKLAPSYLAGNKSLVCPSQYVFESTKKALECFYDGGVSDSDVAFTNGNPSLAEFATKVDSVRLVSFTGSNSVGKQISKNCADNHPKLILEMGGTNPLVVLPSANISKAAEAVAQSAISNGGQRCAAGTIVLAHSAIAKALQDELILKLESDPFAGQLADQNTPLISDFARSKHDDFIESQRQAGATVTRFPAAARAGSSVPALLDAIQDPRKACSEELFSPMIRFLEINTLQEAIFFANSLPLRLTAAVWTNNLSDLKFAEEHLEFGLINFNGPTFGSEPNFPFGGMGRSGNGTRDAGFGALEEYSQTRIWTMVDPG